MPDTDLLLSVWSLQSLQKEKFLLSSDSEYPDLTSSPPLFRKMVSVEVSCLFPVQAVFLNSDYHRCFYQVS